MTPELDTEAFLLDARRNARKLLSITIIVLVITILLILVFKLTTREDEGLGTSEKLNLELEAANIPTLNLGHYALWTVDTAGEYHFFKRFNFYQDQLVSLDGTELRTWKESAPHDIAKYVVTIEREGDRDEIPNSVIFLQATAKADVATLSQELVALDLAQASFLLASPSDGNSEVNEQSGIWFTKPNMQESGLQLPALAIGNWIWEARVQDSSGHDLLIGKFSQNAGYDNFDDYAAQAGQSPPFPGQDFLRNLPDGLTGPLNLANGKYQVIISLEPYLGEADFTGEEMFMPILSADIDPGQAVHESVQLQIEQEPIVLNIRVL